MLDITQDKNTSEVNYRMIASGKKFQFGLLTAFITICIWASWLVSVKIGVKSVLTTFDLAVMRYAIPALLFTPFLYKSRHLVLNVPKLTLLGITLGAGIPFFFLSSAGMHYAPVSHAGLLIPGTFPLFVTAIAFFVFKEPLSRTRFLGLIFISLGIIALLLISIWSLNNSVWKGDLLFISASFLWAIYTISLRVAGLPPLVSTALLCVVSTLVLLLLLFSGIVTSNFNLVSFDELASQFFVQSILVGLCTGFTYGYAINSIGAERTAAMGALTPVFASLLAMFLLTEMIGIAAIFGLFFICIGVIFASGVIKS